MVTHGLITSETANIISVIENKLRTSKMGLHFCCSIYNLAQEER